jgi:nuclear pore complex protein Nup205
MASDNSGATKAVTFGTHSDPRQDLSWMCGMLVPTLERLELLSEVWYLISAYCL